MVEMVFFALSLFVIKHFVFDFLLQTPYQYLNKGKYCHPGGILHSVLQAVGTFAVVYGVCLDATLAYVMSTLDFVIHYHVDWAKVKLNDAFKLDPNKKEFWWLLGLDQLLHSLTYLLIVFIMISSLP